MDSSGNIYVSDAQNSRIQKFGSGLVGFAIACLKDDATGDVVQFNTQTGDYSFTRCSSGLTLSGKGKVKVVNGVVVITDSQSDRRVRIAYLPNQLTGRAIIMLVVGQGVTQTFSINDTKSLGKGCFCGSPS